MDSAVPSHVSHRVATDLSECRDKPVVGVGLLDDGLVWLVLVRPTRGILVGATLVFRLEFGAAFPVSAPSVSSLSYVPPAVARELAAWTPAHTMRGFLCALRDGVDCAQLAEAEAAAIIGESRATMAREPSLGEVYICTEESASLAASVAAADTESRVWLTASQLFSLSSSGVLGLSTSGVEGDWGEQ